MERALTVLGVENAGDIGMEPHGFQGLHDTSTPLPIGDDVELCRVALWLSTPPHVRGWYEDQFATIFTMWESTDMPVAFRENLHNFDRVIVPSEQNRELFSKFHPDVRYCPLGVDGDAWHFRLRPPVEREFRFLSAGYGPRKGCDLVAKAFLKVFPKGLAPDPLGPIPKLILKSRDDITGPGISSISAQLSTQAEIDLYANAHCFVSGSKGEGWGLMPLQAISQGLPTILGDHSGHRAFARYGLSVDTHLVDASRATFWGDGGFWWEPNLDEVCDYMWEVYNNYDAYAKTAEHNAHFVGHHFSWKNAAHRLIYHLQDQLDLPGPAERVWKGAKPHLFYFRVNKNCAYTINGVVNAFEPGRDYWEAADLLRAVMAGGHLDWDTFNPDALGREDNVDLEALRARNSICPTCHQPYNRDQTLAELVGALDA